MLQAKTRWEVGRPDEQAVRRLAEEAGIEPLLARLLVRRGVRTAAEAEAFLHPVGQPFHDPFLLHGMERAIRRLERAIHHGERVLVYGDYDADGVCSTSVMVSALQEAGAAVEFYIPNRFTEGYGPNLAAFRAAKERGVSVIVTVDNGIAALKEVAAAREWGLDVIVTDHHEPGPSLPEAYAIIHPKQPGSTYPFHSLAGVGVAFKVAHALLGRVPRHLLDLVAIGTIADLVPLVGENRLLAAQGLAVLRETTRIGLRALFQQCRIQPSQIDEQTVGFAIAPRLNAVGRLGGADPAVALLMTDDEDEAMQLAAEMDERNRERQQLVAQIADEAADMVRRQYPPEQHRVLVVAGEGWNPGVVGIVASKLVEQFYRPAVVLSIDRDKGIAKGSARSIHGFDLFASLSKCRDMLPHFGGHPMAAGMTLALDDVERLRQRLNAIAAETLVEDDFIPPTFIDAVCSVEELTLSAARSFERLAPFGVGNPRPLLLIEEAAVETMRRVGANGAHMKAVFSQQQAAIDVIGFGLGPLCEEIAPGTCVSAVGELLVNEWNGMAKPQLSLCDVSVNRWQLFDARGCRDVHSLLERLPEEKRLLVAFRRQTETRPDLAPFCRELHFVMTEKEAEALPIDGRYVVLLDLPPRLDLLGALLGNGQPARIYAVFAQPEGQFFRTFPTRDHFKWFYAFLHKHRSFPLAERGGELARARGWTTETVHFMAEVFLELGFVREQNGVITLVRQPVKRDLTESPAYRRRRDELEAEHQLLYSTYEQLKRCLTEMIRSQTNEEASASWI
ncbi:single-stranded-DNA-specific exonuclease RecJ [Geobacillus sp. C56-T2]|uniref:single-stranded-DNA-specific exonuclease RecJ n=1 Tax=Geobacillus sp. C56-T2 TaxID=600773 RepID=UPI00119CF20C|nr:single-stranded-DNA-specific exonuclease RecJ [Geobacillus sp. C56-T2]NNV05601.1 single-stranded-DNA-specific exonuclease RecJ [Geobacillus sp. MMMUD3]TWG31343.1 single-stranded-DNA-specific exonuclease [Geobacillus sp. C56-T2]